MPILLKKSLFIALLLITVLPWITAPVALILGIVYVTLWGFPFDFALSKWSNYLLKTCIVGIGFGLSAEGALAAGISGLAFTLFSVAFTMALGILLIQWISVPFKTGNLINSGTAICGASAIAAMAPILKARTEEIGVAMGIVFIFNAIALITFPVLGHVLGMSPQAFGMWSAVAIHDTSSVVGAATTFGEESIETATTIKLIRILWLIPLSAFMLFLYNRHYPSDTPGVSGFSIPLFIPAFAAAVLIGSFVPAGQPAFEAIYNLARQGFVAVLFLVGAGMPIAMLRQTGLKPFLLGALLWIAMSAITLAGVIWIV